MLAARVDAGKQMLSNGTYFQGCAGNFCSGLLRAHNWVKVIRATSTYVPDRLRNATLVCHTKFSTEHSAIGQPVPNHFK